MSFISYAQNFEDVMLWRALKHVENGFYVDVGAQDPVADSVSLAFYERGWRGVHVEPVNEYAQLLRAARPDEEVIEKAVGAETGEMTLHVIPGTGLSSLVEGSVLNAVALRGYEHAELVVPVITLDELLAPYAGRDIHWLKIDVEGAELDVLRGWNAKRGRPWIMVVEATVPNSQEECHQAWEPILLAADYRFVYFDGLSRFYVAKEHCDLGEAFCKPPNIFDEFQRADLFGAITDREEIARQCNEVRRQLGENTEQLEVARRQLVEADGLSLRCHHLLERAETDMARLTAENAQLTTHLDQTRSELRGVQSELKSMSEERQRTQAEIATLAAELEKAHSGLRDLDSEIRSVAQERQNALGEIRALTAKRDSVVNSASWRLTGPLRRLKRIISRR